MADTPPPRDFLLLHGWQNRRPPEHWQYWLAAALTARGQRVDYPQLPDPDDPDLDRWLAALRTRLAASGAADLTVICHSLACALWLHAVSAGLGTPVARVLLVAPPSSSFLGQHPEVAAFVPPPLTPAHLAAAAGRTRIVASDNDPCCPEGALPHYGVPLGIPTTVLPGTAHLNPPAGYGPWPALLEWSLSPDADPRITPAQR